MIFSIILNIAFGILNIYFVVYGSHLLLSAIAVAACFFSAGLLFPVLLKEWLNK